MPENMRNAMTSAEIQRRLRNTSTDLPRSYLEDTLRNYMDELKAGGYLDGFQPSLVLFFGVFDVIVQGMGVASPNMWAF